jgi:hypothetical protein
MGYTLDSLVLTQNPLFCTIGLPVRPFALYYPADLKINFNNATKLINKLIKILDLSIQILNEPGCDECSK